MCLWSVGEAICANMCAFISSSHSRNLAAFDPGETSISYASAKKKFTPKSCCDPTSQHSQELCWASGGAPSACVSFIIAAPTAAFPWPIPLAHPPGPQLAEGGRPQAGQPNARRKMRTKVY